MPAPGVRGTARQGPRGTHQRAVWTPATVRHPPRRDPPGASARVRRYTGVVAELTERAVTARVPTLVSQPLTLVGRRHPVSVPPGTTLGDCLLAIQRTGTGDSVFVTDADGRLAGVLTERDIFGRLVGPDVAAGVDLDVPVEAFMTTSPRTLQLAPDRPGRARADADRGVPQRARRR